VLTSELPTSAVLDLLRRAASRGETRRVPDPLRAEDVDTLDFVMTSDKAFRIVPEGLRNGLIRPRISVEGRGEVVSASTDRPAEIHFEVGLDDMSVMGLATLFTVLGGLALYNLLTGSISAFITLVAFAAIMGSLVYIQARTLVARAWPGLIIEAQKIADGSLYVPTA